MDENLILDELKEIKDDVKEIKTALYVGNGKPSLMQRVADVEKVSDGIKRVVWLIVGALMITATGVIATQLAIHWPR